MECEEIRENSRRATKKKLLSDGFIANIGSITGDMLSHLFDRRGLHFFKLLLAHAKPQTQKDFLVLIIDDIYFSGVPQRSGPPNELTETEQ